MLSLHYTFGTVHGHGVLVGLEGFGGLEGSGGAGSGVRSRRITCMTICEGSEQQVLLPFVTKEWTYDGIDCLID